VTSNRNSPQTPGESGSGGFDWVSLIAKLLHPVQVAIIEAFNELLVPLSATDIQRIVSGAIEVKLAAYHLKRLVDLGVLVGAWSEPGKGGTLTFYFFADRPIPDPWQGERP